MESTMKLLRREFLRLAVGGAVMPAYSRAGLALDYPTRPVHIVVGAPAAGPIDISARLIAQWLSERLGQPFVVENRPGAAGNIGTEIVVRSAPDGHTLLMAFAGAAINATLYDKLNFDFLRDMMPVASVNRIPLVLEVYPAFPARSVSELIAYAKANPGKVNLASPGNGTAPQVAGELFKMLTGVNMISVPYRGSGPMLPDLLSGQVQVAFDGIVSSIEHIRAGKLRALAVSTASRLEVLPEIPTVAESVPHFEASGWCGICAPKNTPSEIVDRLNKEINAALIDPKIKSRLADVGAITFQGSPGDFHRFIADETEKWAKVIKFANIKPG
jgi:tripartite-type tricarboxylate transporter receptor subunit TctC